MSKNIFQLWKDNAERLPFAVRRDNWAAEFLTVVESVEITRWPYGIATGYAALNGIPNDHYEYDGAWRAGRVIPCAGSYQWTMVAGKLVDGRWVEEGEWKPPVVLDRKASLLRAGDALPFGKQHRGKLIEAVIGEHPDYVSWMLTNVNSIVIDPALVAASAAPDRHGVKPEAMEANQQRYALLASNQVNG
jgi:hypothetical protein